MKFKIERISQNQAIISLEALKTLIDVVKKVDEVEIDEVINDLPIEELMMLEETGGAFDFLKDEKEEIYTVNDLKVRSKILSWYCCILLRGFHNNLGD